MIGMDRSRSRPLALCALACAILVTVHGCGSGPTPPRAAPPSPPAVEPPAPSPTRAAWLRELSGVDVFDDSAAVGVRPDGGVVVIALLIGLDRLFSDSLRERGVAVSDGAAVLLLSSSGELEEVIPFGVESGIVQPEDLIVAPNGEVIVGGSFFQTVDLAPGPREVFVESSTFSAFVLRLDSSAELLDAWTFQGDDAMARVQHVDRAPDGAIYVAGEFEHTIDFDPSGGQALRTSSSPSGRLELFILKLEADGRLAWVGTFPGVGSVLNHSICNGMVALPDGGVLLTSRFTGTVDLDPSPGQTEVTVGSGAFALALDPDGVLRWVSVVESQDGSVCIDSAGVDEAGEITVSGWLNGTVDLDPGPSVVVLSAVVSSSVEFVLNLDRDGGYRRTHGLEHPWPSREESAVAGTMGRLTVAPDGSALVGTWATGEERGITPRRSDIFLIGIGVDGALVSSPRTLGLDVAALRPFDLTRSDEEGLVVIGRASRPNPELDTDPDTDEFLGIGPGDLFSLFVTWLPLEGSRDLAGH